jgi:Ca-activated chloride channel homolog
LLLSSYPTLAMNPAVASSLAATRTPLPDPFFVRLSILHAGQVRAGGSPFGKEIRMQRWFPVLLVALGCAAPAHAAGLLIPTDKDVPPLAMVSHEVSVAIQDQAAVTTVTQVFRNSTSRPLEATYLFPVPKNASVNKFTMWVDGKEVAGEMVEADKAREVYTGIVRRMQDPGLLEYLGNNLLRLRVYPVPAHGDQKLMVKFTSLAEDENGFIEYTYPLKADGKNTDKLEKFTFHATLKSQLKVQNVYSPSHAVKIKAISDKEVHVSFEAKQTVLDKDLQLFYDLGNKDIGLTVMTHRPDKDADGTFMLLVSPRVELSESQEVPRDMVFVLDTSGSMAGVKMEQARKAMRYCVNQLGDKDRFALMNFATTVNKYRDGLTEVSLDELAHARKWIDHLEAGGATAIDAALDAALSLRSSDATRNFTIVFFTDGEPTIGETNPDTILSNVAKRNTANTRIFTFGVGDDVNAVLLDRLAQQTRAVSTYVRPAEDIEAKVSGLYAKISHPVMTNLKLTAGNNITLKEMYPTQLPDLFHGGQLIVMGKYSGSGHAALTLSGQLGQETKDFIYEVKFPKETNDDKAFVADLWARRKVGFLLDQIRVNGEKKELVDEVISLAKKHGITTPYTSYLVVPDSVQPPVITGNPGWRNLSGDSGSPNGSTDRAPTYQNHGYQINSSSSGGGQINYAPVTVQPSIQWAVPAEPMPVPASAPSLAAGTSAVYSTVPSSLPSIGFGSTPPSPLSATSGGYSAATTGGTPVSLMGPRDSKDMLAGVDQYGHKKGSIQQQSALYARMRSAFANGKAADVQGGELGVDVALQLNELQTQERVTTQTTRQVWGRTLIGVGGLWVDDKFDAKLSVVRVKAQSDAYFLLLAKQPQLKEVFQLGNRVAWITPSGTVLIVDGDGKEHLSEDEIAKLFATK